METAPAKNIGLLFGLITGLAVIIYTYFLYRAGVDAYLGTFAWLMYVIILAVGVAAGLRQKGLNGGFLPFGDALKTVFTVFVLSFLLQSIFTFILFNYVDTPFRDAVGKESIKRLADYMKRTGAQTEQIEKMITESNTRNDYSFRNVLLGFGTWCIVWFLVSLIIAAIIKKNKPPFENTFNQ